ncbi:MAG: caspase family protein [Spirochaetales bacterium]|nr:caspase family protein [Spirochaetales bacterium]
MKKCAVIIGVNKTNGLPELFSACESAKEFKKWATSQGIETEILTDEAAPVRPHMIVDAVRKFVDLGTYDQIIIYFSGHGILRSPGEEQWLLSDAPHDSNAAINLLPSKALSKRSGIPHVVFISDACRSKPDTIESTGMFGSVIFPNNSPKPTTTNVDLLFATAPGEIALEANLGDASDYKSIYTEHLLKGLKGEVPEIITPYKDGSDKYGIVMAYELSEYLRKAVPEAASSIKVTLTQIPDADITSRSPKHISKISDFGSDIAPISVTETDSQALESSERNTSGKKIFRDTMSFSKQANFEKLIVESLFDTVDRIPHVYTGFTLIGLANLTHQSRYDYGVQIINRGRYIDIEINDDYRNDVYLLRTRKGEIIPLTILKGFIGTAIFHKGSLVTVNYSPSRESEKYHGLGRWDPEIIRRRAEIAASIKRGIFKIDGDKVAVTWAASYYRYLKEFDPTLGLYAAYAYAQEGMVEEIDSIYRFMSEEPEPVLFDVAMLRNINRNRFDYNAIRSAASFCPMLTQGWSYLSINPEQYSQELTQLSRYLIPGLWTRFHRDAESIIRNLI